MAAVGGSQDGATEPEHTCDVARRQYAATIRFDEAIETVVQTEALDASIAGGLDDGTDHRIQARRVAAAGEDPESFNGCHAQHYRGACARCGPQKRRGTISFSLQV